MSSHFSGLKDLADFLPASLATIVSYFSAEVTRGVWKPASMNGSDWPSPSVNLSMVDEHIKKIVAATGVDVPRLVTGAGSCSFPAIATANVPIFMQSTNPGLMYCRRKFFGYTSVAIGCFCESHNHIQA